MIEIRHLRYFVSVAESGSLRRAAEEIYVAQSSLSRSLKSLEQSLGVSLFERGARGVELTSYGRLLIEPARRILLDVDALPAQIGADPADVRGHVTLGASTGGAQLIFGRVAERIGRENPHIELTLGEGLHYSLLEGLDTGRIDLAILVDPHVDARLEISLLAKEGAHLIGRGDDPRMPSDPCQIEYLAEVPLVLYPKSTGSRMLLERVARDSGVRLDVAYEVESQEVLRDFVSRGLGFAVVPHSSMNRAVSELQGIEAVPVTGVEFRRDLARRADRELRPAVATVMRAIEAEIEMLVSDGSLAAL